MDKTDKQKELKELIDLKSKTLVSLNTELWCYAHKITTNQISEAEGKKAAMKIAASILLLEKDYKALLEQYDI